MTTMAKMIAIGIHGTRAVRRAPAALRAGHSKRHSKTRGRETVARLLQVPLPHCFGCLPESLSGFRRGLGTQ